VAQEQGFQDELLGHLAGTWILRGTIAGEETTHDIVAEWVLGHYYMRLREVSREKTEEGAPLYEAIVFIGWDQPSSRYVCLWLDSTGGGGLAGEALGYAEPGGDELAFLFKMGEDKLWHTTFFYDRDGDTWKWLMYSESEGMQNPFARVTLTRKHETDR
jgi:hypothetical protein